ncbi:Phosphoenolpyruvate/pyruvate domain-containing protein [Mycena sanguinolenta]|uniref:Phosphoenolpyruvate/pyruvate domain-containing protein n=1 Tax=Mycena sanguinolenta TaxID=230812 RepID=A0A8H6WXY7_9AGAR|nr:Phosphoenolpyruvate/pyruvate domain-containing protein [Mycena sanguinolenta]
MGKNNKKKVAPPPESLFHILHPVFSSSSCAIVDTHTHLASTFEAYRHNLCAGGVEAVVDVWRGKRGKWGEVSYRFVIGVHPHEARLYDDAVDVPSPSPSSTFVFFCASPAALGARNSQLARWRAAPTLARSAWGLVAPFTVRDTRWAATLSCVNGIVANVQDLRDVDGDKISRRRTPPIVLGDNFRWVMAVIICTAPFVCWLFDFLVGYCGLGLAASTFYLAHRVVSGGSREYDHQTYMEQHPKQLESSIGKNNKKKSAPPPESLFHILHPASSSSRAIVDTHTHLASTFEAYRAKYPAGQYETVYDFVQGLGRSGGGGRVREDDLEGICRRCACRRGESSAVGGVSYWFVMGMHPHEAQLYDDAIEADIVEAMTYPRSNPLPGSISTPCSPGVDQCAVQPVGSTSILQKQEEETMAVTSAPLLSSTQAKELKTLHKPGRPIVFANIHDVSSLSAVLSLNTSTTGPVRAIATGSYAIAETLGVRDQDLTFEQHFAALEPIAAHLRTVSSIPLSIDLQDGYGARLEESMQRAISLGAVGANIEDSIPERGLTAGVEGSLRSTEEQVRRIETALRVAAEMGVPDFVINARTDVMALVPRPEGAVEETVKRGKAFLEAGATTVFVWGREAWLE